MEAASAPTSHSRCLDVGHLAASRGINALPVMFQAQFQELGGGADHYNVSRQTAHIKQLHPPE